jgi:hypothetical protein
MRKQLSLAIAVALVLAVASITLASASPPAASVASTNNKDHVQVIHLVSRVDQETFLDLGEQGDSLGDQIVFSDNLFRGGKKVGISGATCTLVRLEPRVSVTFQCVGTLSLPRGQITVQGLVSFPEADQTPFFVAITGGTGAYRTAHGEMKVTIVSETLERLTLHLIL